MSKKVWCLFEAIMDFLKNSFNMDTKVRRVGIYPYKVISCGRVRITMPLGHQKFNIEQLIVVQLFFISLNPYIKTDSSIFMFKKFIFVVWCRQKWPQILKEICVWTLNIRVKCWLMKDVKRNLCHFSVA